MITLTKENVLDYLHDKLPSLSFNDNVQVHLIGEGDLGADIEGDGYCNYVFRVSDGNTSCIVKQSTRVLRKRGSILFPERIHYEYEIMKIREAIVPQYVPHIYLGDFNNNVIVMEDVSNLRLIRFEFNKDHQLPLLAVQAAQYLAATHFYTSEFYMDTHEYRKQIAHFMNPELRQVMENGVFLRIFGADDYDKACGPEFREYCESIRFDPDLQFQRYKLRHLFMTKSETLIHGDFHTSNMFADDENLKIIDMEYTFGAPFSYDLGFIIANFISQFCSATFRPYDTEEERDECLSYLLSLTKMFYIYYIQFFFEYWDKDAKLEYRITNGFREALAKDILKECFGFAACANFSRVCGDMETADFDMIEDNTLRTKAKFMSAGIDAVLFRNWHLYEDIDEPINDLITLMKIHRYQ